MLGCFETFFAQHGLLYESFLAVFLHGTLEISALIIAGAAGLAMGNSWLFPGTYSRIVSFAMVRKGNEDYCRYCTYIYIRWLYRRICNTTYGNF